MEKHLGWLAGATGALLLGVTSPLLVMAGTSPAAASSTTGTHATPLASDSSSHSGSQNNNTEISTIYSREISNDVRQAGTIAKHAVGGGAIKQLTTSKLNGTDVYKVYVRKPQESWVVNVSMHDYSVLNKQRLL